MNEMFKRKLDEILNEEFALLEKKPHSLIMQDVTKRIITLAYKMCYFNTTQTAKFLTLNRTTLMMMLQRYDITPATAGDLITMICPMCNQFIAPKKQRKQYRKRVKI
jgi:DNA-binding protein Fis